MATGAYFKLQITNGGASFEFIATNTRNDGFLIFGMDTGFHSRLFLSAKEQMIDELTEQKITKPAERRNQLPYYFSLIFRRGIDRLNQRIFHVEEAGQ
jgi:hypothetical protein